MQSKKIHDILNNPVKSLPQNHCGFRLREVLFFLALLCIGCTTSFSQHMPFASSSAFPPQRVMENGDYKAFLAANTERLQKCGGETDCGVALFNLGFAYAFPDSPYRDRDKALKYFGQLMEKYPQSSWAFQARAWTALVSEQSTLEANQHRLQTDLQRAKTNLRSRETTVRTLQDQLDRSQQIDIEIEKKSRELLR